jgi:glycerophosphoryl diester phosphodiesterase
MMSVRVFAHRGFSGIYPENTEIAFCRALDLGVDGIEFDLRATRDGHLVAIHDPTVDRTSNGSGPVSELTLDQIKNLDAGSWTSPEFAGQSYLTLKEVLDIVGHRAELNIHLKADQTTREMIVRATISEIKARNLLDEAFVASDQETIALCRRIHPRLRTCNLTTDPVDSYISRSRGLGCSILQPKNADVDIDFVVEAHALGMVVNPFYADDPGEMKRLIDCGVDGILTNRPDLLEELGRDGD